MADYKVAKVQEQSVKVPGGLGGNNDVVKDASKPWGAQSNPASNPDFKGEFSAEKDLQTLIAAAKIRRDKVRFNRAVELKERLANIALKDGSGSFTEIKGPNNKGVRTKAVNSFDHRSGATKPNNGTRMDGKKDRW